MTRQTRDQRRQLCFDAVTQVMPDVRRLVSVHRVVANWSLAQVCEHLAHGFIGSMEGFDLRNHRIKRFFIKRRMLQVAITQGIPRGWTVDPRITPRENVDLHEAIDALDAAIRRYLAHDGKLHAHPLFGRMKRETWDRVHCVHCAHHLSFVVMGDDSFAP